MKNKLILIIIILFLLYQIKISYNNLFYYIEQHTILQTNIQNLEKNIAKNNKTVEQQLFIADILINYSANRVVVTSYSPSIDETDSTPFITASGDSVHENHIAVSRDLYRKGWTFGKKVYIKDLNQTCIIKDLMNKRFKNRIDLFAWNKKDALEFGKKKHIAYLIGE